MEGHVVHDICDEVEERSLPLSPAQLGVYFDHLRDEGGNRFNIGQVTTIAGDLDVAVFRRAAADVIAQTPALQMAIVVEDGEPRQRLWIDLLLRSRSTSSRGGRIQRRLARNLSTPWRLPPLIWRGARSSGGH